MATGLTDAQRAEIVAFIDKAYDRANGGWSKSKLVDGPTLGWFLDRAKAGDKEAEARLRRSLTAQIALIDTDLGGISQVSLKPDWSAPSREFPMFAQQAALAAYARAWVLFGDPAYRAAADRIFGFLKNTLAGPGGGFYASMGMAEGQPGVDKRQYARETGQAIQGLTAYYDATGDTSGAGARASPRPTGRCASAACRAAASAMPSAIRADPISPTMSKWAGPCWRCIARPASASGWPPRARPATSSPGPSSIPGPAASSPRPRPMPGTCPSRSSSARTT